jgi:hypothetical protein
MKKSRRASPSPTAGRTAALPPPAPPIARLVLGTLFVVLLVGWAFHGALDCAFVEVDDADLVTENPFVRRGLTGESVRWAFTNLETT